MKFHPYADVFPLIEGEDFDRLVEDIKAFGLREPIWRYEGKILDGRNRFLACQKARVRPQFRDFKGTPQGALAFVRSVNDVRRHLTQSQRALAASRIKEHLASLNLDSGDLTTMAAEQMGVSRASVFHADKVRQHGSKQLEHAVESGEVSVSRAAAVVDLPKAQQLKAATQKKPEPIEERWEPEDDEAERLTAIEREQEASLQKWLDADDKLAAAHAEIKRLAAEVAVLKISRDGFQNRCGEQARIIKSLRNKLAKLEKSAA